MAAKIQPTNQTKINRKKLDKLNSIKIWRMQQRINRKKLDKLNSIKICEEILNPSVPMALRLSGILKGGVVIVYERKVKLLFDDVSRLLVEINEAWKIKALPDPTVLPKGKSQAKYEAVTVRERMMGTDGLSGRNPMRTGLSGRTSTLPGPDPGPNEPSKVRKRIQGCKRIGHLDISNVKGIHGLWPHNSTHRVCTENLDAKTVYRN